MFKFLIIFCLLAIANIGVFGGLIAAPAPAAIALARPAAIALPTIAAAPLIKAPLITAIPAQPSIALASPLKLG